MEYFAEATYDPTHRQGDFSLVEANKMDAFHHSRNSSQNREQRDDKSQPLLKIGHYVLGDTLGVGTFGKVKGIVSVTFRNSTNELSQFNLSTFPYEIIP